MGPTPGVEIPVTPDGPGALDANRYPARPWGGWLGVGFVECVGLIGGLLGAGGDRDLAMHVKN